MNTTSTSRAVQREAILSKPEFSTLSKQDKLLLSNTLSFFQEESRLKRGSIEVIFEPSKTFYSLIRKSTV